MIRTKPIYLMILGLLLVASIFADGSSGGTPPAADGGGRSGGAGSSGLGTLQNQLGSICTTAKGILGVGIMLMIILAGVIYSVGQLLGAETRARATVWGTAMLLGALIAAIIYVIVPPILQVILNSNGPGGNITLTC